MPPSTLLSWHNLKQIQKMYIRCAILQKTPWHDAQQLRTYSSLTGRKMNIPCAIPPSTLLSWHNIQKKTLNYLFASVPTLCDFPKHTAVMAHTPTIPKSLPKGVCLPKIPKKKLNKQLYVVLQSTWLRKCKKLVVWIKSYRSNEAQLCRSVLQWRIAMARDVKKLTTRAQSLKMAGALNDHGSLMASQ